MKKVAFIDFLVTIRILPILFFLFFSLNNFAQTNEKIIKPMAGLGFYKVQDQVISPLIYKGAIANFGLIKSKKSSKKLSKQGVFYGSGNLKNSFQNNIKMNTGQLYYSLLKPIGKNFYIGGASQTNFAIRNYELAKFFGLESLSGDIFSTINLSLAHETNLKKWGKFQTQLDIAVAGVAFSRKMFTLVTNPDLIVVEDKIWKSVLKSAEIISFSKLKKVNLDVSYIKSVGKNNSISLDFGINIYHYQRLNVSTISQNTNISVGYLIHY